MFWCASEFMPPVGVLNWENWIKPMIGAGTPDAARAAQAETELHAVAAVLNAHLHNRTWISGDQLSLADLALATPMMHTTTSRLPVTDLSHLNAWWVRVRELPAWRQTEPAM
jgi:glutathione S-transferase